MENGWEYITGRLNLDKGSRSGEAEEEGMRLIKQILMRYWKKKLCLLVLNLYCQPVRVSGGVAYLVSTSWAEPSSWCAQTNHQSSILPVRKRVAEHRPGCTQALPRQRRRVSRAQIPGPGSKGAVAWKSRARFIPTGRDWQEPPERYCNGSGRIRRAGEERGKKQTYWNGREKLEQMLIILKAQSRSCQQNC